MQKNEPTGRISIDLPWQSETSLPCTWLQRSATAQLRLYIHPAPETAMQWWWTNKDSLQSATSKPSKVGCLESFDFFKLKLNLNSMKKKKRAKKHRPWPAFVMEEICARSVSLAARSSSACERNASLSWKVNKITVTSKSVDSWGCTGQGFACKWLLDKSWRHHWKWRCWAK